MAPPRALLAEAEAQKVDRINDRMKLIERERKTPALDYGAPLIFTHTHPRWSRLLAMLANMRQPVGGPIASIVIHPDPMKSPDAWRFFVSRLDYGGLEGPVAEADVYACFEDAP